MISLFAVSGNWFSDQHPQLKKYHPEVQLGTRRSIGINREYSFVLNGTFLLVKNTSTYVPQEKNPKGEVYEDWGLFSRDRSHKLFVLRQFNIEGFVNRYTLDTLHTDSATMIFTTEAIENIQSGWRARETYKALNQNEFVETFEVGSPGKEFEGYSETHLRRVKK